MPHIRFVKNDIYTPTEKTVKGKDFLVAPVVALKEGIYKGEYVTEDQIQNNPESWNGRPVVMGHPVDDEGFPITANDPDVLSNHQIGYLYNTKAEGSKLKGEVWVDLEMAEGVERGNDVVEWLKNNVGMMEVSTAYFRNFQFEPGVFNGEYYEGRSTDIKPDHLAILLDKKGECSNEDGCGFPRTNSEEENNMEKTELEEGLSLFERGVEQLKNALKPNQKRSNPMDEKIKAILDSKLVAFSQEELEGFCEEKINSLHALVTAPPKEDEPVTNEDPVEDPVEDEVEEPAVDVAGFMDKEFADFGGLDGVKKTLSGLRANEEKEKGELVARLVSNDTCPLDKEALEAMTVKTLQMLDRSYAPADYSGLGSGANLQVQHEDVELDSYKAPQLIEKE